jgi:putative restriction endonuclease
MSQSSWNDLIANIRTWKHGETRAVNKPLLTLMVLSRAQREESNEFRFREIEDPLKKALRDFGPPRKAYHPEYPFWYLQNDGFWTIPGATALLQGGAQQPTARALADANAVAIVPETLWSELRRDPAQIGDLAEAILDAFWPDSIHETIAAELDLDLDLDRRERASRSRKRDPQFRPMVLRAYERRCAICGFEARLGDALLGIEAAHIHFKVDDGPDVVTNGLALCSLHHKAFDLGAIGITTDLRIIVSQDLTGNGPARRIFIEHSGEPINRPQTVEDLPAAEFLRWNERYVFHGPPRKWT